MSKVAKLAAQLLRDRERHANREREQRARPLGSEFNPFEVGHWRVAAPGGGEPGYLPTMAMRKGEVGFHVFCRGCGAEFESKGMAYCVTCLDLPAEERYALKPAVQGRLCQGPGCENFIDRKRRANVRFCSERCGNRARRAATAPERRL
jgi:hypothetical protein